MGGMALWRRELEALWRRELEAVQPAGISAQLEDDGEDVILEPENTGTEIPSLSDDDGECEACTI